MLDDLHHPLNCSFSSLGKYFHLLRPGTNKYWCASIKGVGEAYLVGFDGNFNIDLVQRCGVGPAQGRIEEVHLSDEVGDKGTVRTGVKVVGGADLLNHSLTQDGKAVSDGHRLLLVVGNKDRGDVGRFLDATDLSAHVPPELGIKVG